MSKLCPYCKSKKVGLLSDTVACCTTCHRVFGKSQLIDNTVFHRITSSPEVLAEKLVYCVKFVTVGGNGFERWYSTLLPFDKDIYFYSREKAIAATVARLNEVANE